MINFPFGTKGKLIILGVPILKHITVVYLNYCCFFDSGWLRFVMIMSVS